MLDIRSYLRIVYYLSEYAWKTIAKIATDVIEKMDILVSILDNQKKL